MHVSYQLEHIAKTALTQHPPLEDRRSLRKLLGLAALGPEMLAKSVTAKVCWAACLYSNPGPGMLLTAFGEKMAGACTRKNSKLGNLV